MDQTFKFLTRDDLRLLSDHIVRKRFERDQVILAEGSTQHAIFILRDGTARVIRNHKGQETVIARMGPGEVFGELSFLEATGATATVVADGLVEVGMIEGQYVYSLLSSVPGFAARFYHSLAISLAKRLRERTAAPASHEFSSEPHVSSGENR